MGRRVAAQSAKNERLERLAEQLDKGLLTFIEWRLDSGAQGARMDPQHRA